MLDAHKETLEAVVGIIDNVGVNPDVQIDYYIPEVLMTVENRNVSDDPYIQFTYEANGQRPQVQYMPLKGPNLEKEPQDLANLITFSIAQFTEEIDSTFYGAQ
ncbi:hypothetical protein GJV85_02885 [Sulfurimonas aquatica]|uniref:Uncharacterized protein n=1 Tax=Sulfurimonas aquatica TaxID=2672570 RepID=A0A975GC00_9BACT|nr:hypothetical protein [Sulfurimonas aquatica]QSZ41105.1 hypothetical protein GJV85_02885 [Sulfurimonas aquatica]